MELKRFNKGDELGILSLFQKAFGKELQYNFWEWRFANNPIMSEPLIDLMWDSNNMVGHYAVSPLEIKVGNELNLACLSCTTMTDPEYGGRGIFTNLATNLYSRIAKDKGIKFVYGFPNKNSHYGFLKNLAWKDIALVANLSIDGSKVKKAGSSTYTIIENFTTEHSKKADEVIRELGFNISINRSEKYLNWRYINCPINEYLCLEYRICDKLEAIVVAKLFHHSKDNTHDVDIVEFFTTPEYDNISQILYDLVEFYKSGNKIINKINLWMSLMDTRHIKFEKIGFSIGAPLTFMSGIAFEKSFESIYDYRNWYISMGDSDVY